LNGLVLQSYRPGPRPGWIDACMGSVQRWSALKGLNVLVLGDELLEIVPAEIRERCGPAMCPVTDVGRVLWAERLLAQGWPRVVWLDADLLIFDPAGFEIDLRPRLTLCREAWVSRTPRGLSVRFNVNNSVMAMGAGSHLTRYLDFARRRLLDASHRVGELSVGTPAFTRSHARSPVPLADSVAMVNHLLIRDLNDGRSGALRAQAAALGRPSCAAHFTHSYGRESPDRVRVAVGEAAFERAVERVLSSGGAVLQAGFHGERALKQEPAEIGASHPA
jgi:hypothetical protein